MIYFFECNNLLRIQEGPFNSKYLHFDFWFDTPLEQCAMYQMKPFMKCYMPMKSVSEFLFRKFKKFCYLIFRHPNLPIVKKIQYLPEFLTILFCKKYQRMRMNISRQHSSEDRTVSWENNFVSLKLSTILTDKSNIKQLPLIPDILEWCRNRRLKVSPLHDQGFLALSGL